MIIIVLLLLLQPIGLGPAVGTQVPETADGRTLDEGETDSIARAWTSPNPFSGLPGLFVENLGQKDEAVGALYSAGDGLAASFGTSCVAVGVGDGRGEMATYRIHFPGARDVAPEARRPTGPVLSFIKGTDPEGWVTGVRCFQELVYRDLWPGIDLVYRFCGDRLKYDLVVAPGVDPSLVRLDYAGEVGLSVDEGTGDLLVSTPQGALADEAPIAWQVHGAGREEVECAFSFEGGSRVSFQLGEVDPSATLVIDPGIEFGTYFGVFGTAMDVVVATDGSYYLTGAAFDPGLPTSSGAFCQTHNSWDDGFVAKISSDGKTVQRCTYLGGSDEDRVLQMNVFGSSDIYMVGLTDSTDMPTTSGAVNRTYIGGTYDGFYARLSNDMTTLKYCTYLGTNGTDLITDVGRMASDVWVCGVVMGDGFPVTPNAYMRTYQGFGDAVLARFSTTDDSLAYATYIGGGSADLAMSMELDSQGHPVIGLQTYSDDFPVTSGAYSTTFRGGLSDTAVFKMNRDGRSPMWSTFVAGGSDDEVTDLALGTADEVWFCGMTESNNFPTTNDAYQSGHGGTDTECYVSRLSFDGASLDYSTYFAGGAEPSYINLGMNRTGDPVVAMAANGSLFCPGSAYDDSHNGMDDIYLAWIDFTDGRIINATYIGGSKDDMYLWGDVEVASDGTIVICGDTESDDFPMPTGGWCETYTYGDSFLIGVGMEETPWVPPDPPINLSVTAGLRHANLTWDALEGDHVWPFIGYRVYRGISEDRLRFVAAVGNDTKYSSWGLTGGKRYYFSVRSENVVGVGHDSEVVNATPYGIPEAPVLDFIDGGAGNVTIRWQPPASDGGLPLEGYDIHRGMAEDEMAPYAAVGGDVLEYLDENVTPSFEYFYKVRAFHVHNRGPFSGVLSAIPWGPPWAPENLRAITADGRVSLLWDEPSITGAIPVRGYKLFKGETNVSLEFLADTGLDRTYVDEDVLNGRTYYYQALAYNDAGDGNRTAVVSGMPRGPPGTPVELATEVDNRRVTLSWSPPATDGGYEITEYQVWRGTSPSAVTKRVWTGKGTTFSDTDVDNGVEYYYQVVAVNIAGEGPRSSVVSDVPLGAPSPPQGLAIEEGDGELALTWGPPAADGGRPVTKYEVHRGEDPGSLAYKGETDAGTRTFTDTDVDNGQVYHYAVLAISDFGRGPLSDAVSGSPYGVPSAPINVEVEVGQGFVNVTWGAPLDDGGRPLEGFILYRRTPGGEWAQRADTGNGTAFTDEEVVGGTDYEYAVVAFNVRGDGAMTAPVTATPEIVPRTPGAPLDVKVKVGDGKITVTWSEPGSEGSGPITSYVVLRGVHPDRLQPIDEVTGATKYVDKRLEDGRTYYYSVAAKNHAGQGGMGETMKIKYEEKGTPGFPALGALAAIAAVAVLARRRRR